MQYISGENFLLCDNNCVCVCSYKAVILAIKLACAGEEHSASRHVDAHGERLCSKQSLGGEYKKTKTNIKTNLQIFNILTMPFTI